MSAWLSLLAGAVLGAVASLAAAVYFQDRWKDASDRRRRLRRSKAVARSWVGGDSPVSIAGILTSVYLIEGDGDLVIEPSNVRISCRSGYAEMPALVTAARNRIARQLAAAGRDQQRMVRPWNSMSMVALTGYHVSRTADKEDAVVYIDTCLNDYATFAATVLRLDEEVETLDGHGERTLTTLRQSFMPTSETVTEIVRHPLPFLANGIGVMLLAFTDDNKILLSHRRLESRARPGECDVTVVEGIDANFDSSGAGRLDIYATAVRGCREELGVEITPADVRILAFGVDMAYYQWNFFGMVDLKLTADEVLAYHAIHAKDRWEGKIEPVNLDPVDVFDRLRQEKTWDCALITTHLALCKKCGVKSTGLAADRVFGIANRKPPWRSS
jgi:hypothetical protein